jgi:hypothetical protein
MDRTTRSAIRRVREDLARMDQVRRAPRCAHVKSDGVRCGSPALLHQTYCYAHTHMHRPAPGLEQLPPFEDANGIQCALMQVADAIVRGAIDTKRAALLLYALQIASANLKRVSFEPLPHRIVLDELEGCVARASGPPAHASCDGVRVPSPASSSEVPDPQHLAPQPVRDPSGLKALRMTGTNGSGEGQK